MVEETKKREPRVPLSEDPRMDRLEELLRKQQPERREALMDYLNNTDDDEGVCNGEDE